MGQLAMNVDTIRGEVRYDEPMSKHTSWRAGGCADVWVKPADLDDIKVLLQRMDPAAPVMWIGLGSNTLVRDGGFRGTVIALQGCLTQLELAAADTVYAGAGVADAKLARFTTSHSLHGGEFFAGIPGLLGGALAMNAGAWGGETWEHVVSVETIDREGEVRTRDAAEYRVGYRSVEGPAGEWFIAATLRFATEPGEDGVVDIRALLEQRAATQPTGTANSGSVFRNPNGDHAARLIESCGLKGERIGGAVVSAKHANFILNDRAASATDIERLILRVQQQVAEQTGIELQPEVKIVGEPLEQET